MPEQDRLDKVLSLLNDDVLPAIAGVKSDIRDGNTRREILEKKVDENTKGLKGLTEAIYGNGKVGLIRLLDSIKEWVDTRKRIEWLIISGFVAQMILLVLTLIATH